MLSKSLILLSLFTSIVRPELCSTDKVDNMYTKSIYRTDESNWYSRLVIVVNDAEYVLSTERHSVGKPVEVDKERRIQTKIQIFDHQNSYCNESDIECMKKHENRDLIITFYHNQIKGQYWYNYAGLYVNRLDGEVQITRWDLPWNQTVSGDSTNFTKYILWPVEWVTQTHVCAAYDHWNKELVYIINPGNGANETKLARVDISMINSGMTEYNEQQMAFSHEFVGFFNYRNGSQINTIYAITQDLRFFEMTTNKFLEERDISFKELIGCLVTDEEPKDMTPIIVATIFLIIGIVIIIILLLIVVYIKLVVQKENPKVKEGMESIKESGALRGSVTTSKQTEDISIVTVNSETGKPVRDEVKEEDKGVKKPINN